MAEQLPIPHDYGTLASIANQAVRWRDEGVDEVIILDYLMGPSRAA
jgi:hypothetical protein